MNELKFKITNGLLYQSSDNGCTWKLLGNVKGDKGDKGDTGELGPAGQNGIDGIDGTNGTDGEDGENGLPLNMKTSVTQCTKINDAYIVSAGVNKGHLMVLVGINPQVWNDCGSLLGPKGDDGTTPVLTTIYYPAESLEDRAYYEVYSDDTLIATIYDGDEITINDTDFHWYINGFDTGIVAKAGGTVYDGSLVISSDGENVNTFTANQQTNTGIAINSGEGISLVPNTVAHTIGIDLKNPHYLATYNNLYFLETDSLSIEDKKLNKYNFTNTNFMSYILKYSASRIGNEVSINLKYYLRIKESSPISWMYLILSAYDALKQDAISMQQNIISPISLKLKYNNNVLAVDPAYTVVQCNQLYKTATSDDCTVYNYINIDIDFKISLTDFNQFFNKGYMFAGSVIDIKF